MILFLLGTFIVLALLWVFLMTITIYLRPDVVIGEKYLNRWYLIPRNPWFNIYLHQFIGPDDDRACHDHPWYSVSFLLYGSLIEYHLIKDLGGQQLIHKRDIPFLFPVFRSAKYAHILKPIIISAWPQPPVTLFITGPNIRHWGFHCPNGWRPWEEFTDGSGHQIGKGCE